MTESRNDRSFRLRRSRIFTVACVMPAVAPGVEELRIRDRKRIYRAFYYARTPRGVLVFHAFVKKSRTTPQHELMLARVRLQELLDEA